MTTDSTLMTIAGREIGPGHPCFVIAEAGVNHNGDVAMAHELIDLAVAAGADAVKFQTFHPDALVSEQAAAAPYQQTSGASQQHSMLEELTLPLSAWQSLSDHASDEGIVFLSTAFDIQSLELLVDLGVPALKVPSGEADNIEFLRRLASQGLPLILSTGLRTLDEVRRALHALEAAPSVAVLHCVSSYPAEPSACNLLAMQTMRDEFDVPVGWSDHTQGSLTAISAVSLGATIVEKHVTLDPTLAGPDHAASASPSDFKAYVYDVRQAQRALGDGVKRPHASEEANRFHVRRSFHASRLLPGGHVIGASDVALLRPASGLAPSDSPLGRTVVQGIDAGEPVRESDLQP